MNVRRLGSRVRFPSHGRLPGLSGATGWLKTTALRPEALNGKVVAIHFGTYTCINWLRTLPHIRAWADTYGDYGVVVVGIQTPEFAVEHDLEDVRRAVRDIGIDYPIAIDNDYAIWNAFENQYWPALYIADATGNIRHRHFGEGGYERSEDAIRQFAADAGHGELPSGRAPVAAHGIELPADWHNLRSPETYLGVARGQGFASPERAVVDEPGVYTVPSLLQVNQWALAGAWTLGREEATCNEAHGSIECLFHARDLHLILTPLARGTSIRFRVLLDGRAPAEAHGIDVDADGNGIVSEPRLYQLVRQGDDITDRRFGIEFLDPGVAALCFTFG